MGAILDHFRQRFDYIIIDTPPVNAVTDATVVANFADASLLVVEYGKTSYRAAQLVRAKGRCFAPRTVKSTLVREIGLSATEMPGFIGSARSPRQRSA